MVLIPVLCPHCQSDQVIKGGKTETGKQRYRCRETACRGATFLLEYSYPGQSRQALIGFQGRGRGEVVPSDFYHGLFLKALPFQ